MENDAGLQVMRANQANVRNNSAELYTAFLDAILWWGRKLPGQENEPLFTTRLKNISCPTLVICGDNDYFIPTFFSKMIADNIPGSVYREIGGGGHIPFIEKPTKTAATVLEFLGKLSEPGCRDGMSELGKSDGHGSGDRSRQRRDQGRTRGLRQKMGKGAGARRGAQPVRL